MSCKACYQVVDKRSSVKCGTCEAVLHKDCAIKTGGVVLCDVCFVVKGEKPGRKFKDFKLPEAIRRSYIETYRKCPWQFYQTVIMGHEQPPTEYTQVGIDVHDAIENMIKGDFTYEEAKRYIEEVFEGYDNSLFQSKSKDEMYERATRSLLTFNETVYPNLSGIVTTEQTIQFNIGDNIPDVRITMDLVTEDEEGLHLHDWKTGRVMVGKNLSTDLQAPLYIYAVREQFKKNVKSFTFYYINENKTRTFIQSDTNPELYICTVRKREYHINLTDTIREVKSIFSKIVQGRFDPIQDTPNKYFTRKMCHLKEKGLCCQDIDPWNQI